MPRPPLFGVLCQAAIGRSGPEPAPAKAGVLEYLGRFTHRVAISNERIVGIYEGQVAFRVRADSTSGKKRIMHLPGPAFIERFFLHVLPKGFKRIRHYGVLAPARSALAAPTPEPEVIESVAAFMERVAGIDWTHCSACAGHFVVTALIAPQRLHGPLAHGPP